MASTTCWCLYSISTKKSSTLEPKVWWTISPKKNSQQLGVDGFQGLVGHETSCCCFGKVEQVTSLTHVHVELIRLVGDIDDDACMNRH
jgi:hypothetical protein